MVCIANAAVLRGRFLRIRLEKMLLAHYLQIFQHARYYLPLSYSMLHFLETQKQLGHGRCSVFSAVLKTTENAWMTMVRTVSPISCSRYKVMHIEAPPLLLQSLFHTINLITLLPKTRVVGILVWLFLTRLAPQMMVTVWRSKLSGSKSRNSG
jgi:hypothetical protein